jgi:hypothetical protein
LTTNPSRKRSTNQANQFCSAPIAKKQIAAPRAQATARLRAPKTRTAIGTKDADRTRPSGIIAADRPICEGDMPCPCIRMVNSG